MDFETEGCNITTFLCLEKSREKRLHMLARVRRDTAVQVLVPAVRLRTHPAMPSSSQLCTLVVIGKC
jgi:hypothetical protein